MENYTVAPIVMAFSLLAAQPAWAGGHGHYGGSYYGSHHGYYGHSNYSYGYGYSPYSHGYGYSPYSYGYGYSPYYSGYSHYPYYGGYGGGSYYHDHGHYDHAYHDHGYHYHGGLLYGLLSIPAHILGAVFGYPHYHGDHYGPGSYNQGGAAERGAGYGGEGQTNDERAYGQGSTPPAGAGDGGPAGRDGAASADATGNARRGAGWDLLATGNYSNALATFAVEAEGHPTHGVPKVGYALAAAGRGDLGRGIWAMRRAFRIDPHSVEYVVIDERLRPQLEQLVGHYQERIERAGPNPDSAFMLASLRYLLGDTEAARSAIAQALQDGDQSESTRNLKQLIDQRVGHGEGDVALGTQPAPKDGKPSRSPY